MKTLKNLVSLSAVRNYKPRHLEPLQQKQLAKRLKHFTQQPKKLHLQYQFKSQKDYLFVLQKMNRIGLLADTMDHHPQWTLSKDKLLIDLNTHDIKDISQKDYLLAFLTQQILFQPAEDSPLSKWNSPI